jgi:hypothetical protein
MSRCLNSKQTGWDGDKPAVEPAASASQRDPLGMAFQRSNPTFRADCLTARPIVPIEAIPGKGGRHGRRIPRAGGSMGGMHGGRAGLPPRVMDLAVLREVVLLLELVEPE